MGPRRILIAGSDAAPPERRAHRPRSAVALSARTGAGIALHHERTVCQVDRLRAVARAAAIERRPASEVDLVGDQLRAIRTTSRRATGIRYSLDRKIDRSGDVLG